MTVISETEKYFENILKELGYDVDNVILERCNLSELGQFQVNFAMKLAGIYHENPKKIAQNVVDKLDSRFSSVNIAGPGFINLAFCDEYIIKYANESIDDFSSNIDYEEQKTIIVDYGGANAAKALHVGHMRSANIGEALKRLAKLFGNKVIGDVHLGDLGRQSGMLISELMLEQPDLPFFETDFKDEYPKINLTTKDLGRMYTKANLAAKENEERMQQVRKITAEIDKGNKAYTNIWSQMVNISSVTIKETYDILNCHFEAWEGELSSMEYVPNVMKIMKPYLYESNGALVIDVKEDSDKINIPPLIVIKSDGSTIYSTRDLASMYQRMENYNPNEIWYVVDDRQELYLKQVFRAAYKTGLVPQSVKLKHYSFGTINGLDGKPFKTRDGGAMELDTLISKLREEIENKIKDTIQGDERKEICDKLTIATLKYTDLLPFRRTDYIFDMIKFSSLEGKTGPYILYGIARMKSLLNKVSCENPKIRIIPNDDMRKIIVKIMELSKVLKISYNEATLSYIAEYLYELINLFNKFYNDNNIMNEKNDEIKESYVALVIFVYNTCHNLLNILAIDEVERM